MFNVFIIYIQKLQFECNEITVEHKKLEKALNYDIYLKHAILKNQTC